MVKVKNLILLPLVVFLLAVSSTGCDQVIKLLNKKSATVISLDVIELKSGDLFIGEILKESKDAVYMNYANGSIEAWISRERIKNIRKSTPEDLQAAEAERQRWEREKAKIIAESSKNKKAK